MKTPIAKRNISDLNGFENLTNNGSSTMTQTAFATIPVIGIQMIRERELLYNGARLTSAGQAKDAFCALLGNPDREYFVALLLDTKNRITGIYQISQGSLNQSIVSPRETFKAAILNNSAGMILAHNHPSGELKPSTEDLAITRRLKEAGELLNIKILDHLIIDTESQEYYSFVDNFIF